MSKLSIGIFDSGVGGTSIWKEINALLPFENTIYLSDSKNAPYGPKGKERIIELAVKNTEILINRGCKLIVVACNTATTNTIDYLRQNYNLPFIGIEPAIKPAALNTKSNAVGILATEGTLSSALFHKTSTLFAGEINVIEQIGTGIVPLIEDGKLYSKEMKVLLQGLLEPMIQANIDHLVLGCTHYPYLIPILEKLLPKNIKIIDSGEAVARQTKAVLGKNKLLNGNTDKPEIQFYTNGEKEVLESLIGTNYKIEQSDF